MKIEHYYRTAQHRGGLKECLDTESPIEEELFKILFDNDIYTFYGYDERIKANRYILKKHHKNIGLPTWIHEYKKVEK